MKYNFDSFYRDLNQLNISISDYQISQFEKYYDLLLEWNQKMNLTSITDFEDVLKKHFVDSISILSKIDFSKIDSIIDVGTGAGFPGIPLKIMLPHVKFVLMDSLNKRITFLKEVISQLELKDIEVIHSRAEDLATNPEYREHFSLCISRAVANLSTLSEYCIPFVKTGGLFISFKSGEYEDELASASNAINILGGKISNAIEFTLPNSDINRSFIVIRKNKSTNKKYPRKGALAKNKPL